MVDTTDTTTQDPASKGASTIAPPVNGAFTGASTGTSTGETKPLASPLAPTKTVKEKPPTSDTFDLAANYRSTDTQPTENLLDVVEQFLAWILALTGAEGYDLERMNARESYLNQSDTSTDPSENIQNLFDKPQKTFDRFVRETQPEDSELRDKNSSEYKSTSALTTGIVGLISRMESTHNPNAFNDFRTRIKDTQHANKYVAENNSKIESFLNPPPTLEDMTIEEVLNWQDEYLQLQIDYRDSNFPKGIPIPLRSFSELPENQRRDAQIEQYGLANVEAFEQAKIKDVYRSTAVGQFQYIKGTLEGRTAPGTGSTVKRSDMFDTHTQRQIVLDHVTEILEKNKGASNEVIMNKLKGQWEGLTKDSTQAELKSEIESFKQNKVAYLANLNAPVV